MPEVNTTLVEEIIESAETAAAAAASGISVNPMNFVENLKYMGMGMLGIFVVIGAVWCVTIILNKVTSRSSDEKKEEE